MASRLISDLAPPLQVAAKGLIVAGREAGFNVLVYCTLRTLEEQGALWCIGRTVPGRIVTCAQPGQSLHNPDINGQAWAFDAVPMLGGKPQWSNVRLLNTMGALGESLGLEWAGRWTGALKERAHFQIIRK
jgi:peptidoglycan LD-endopeptidase CwlK